MTNLLITGGQQKAIRSQLGTQDWCEYHKGMILGIDTKTGGRSNSIEYFSPPEATSAVRPEVIFKSGTVEGDCLYLCTQTEVMIYALPQFELLSYISLPCFNDLHHVKPTSDGNLLVVNTGLDMVLLMTKEGSVLREWNVIGEDPWARFSRDIDYRKVDTKPHRAHPNYLFLVDDDIWATRFHLKDAVCLTQPGRRIAINVGLPHDGVVHDGMIYFSTVNGYVVIANALTMEIEEIIGLNSIHGPDVQLGWCRGILMDNGHTWIGFSRLRSTKFRENVKWVVQGLKKVLPTRVACYDLKRRKCIAEIDLEQYGLNAVYSIFPANDFDCDNEFEANDRIVTQLTDIPLSHQNVIVG
jgi:hypothetical protein